MSRRQDRENALQMLYLNDICHMTCEEVLRSFDEVFTFGNGEKEFSAVIFEGVLENKTDIDGLICKYAKNWELNRMAAVDRNILRLASYEIVWMTDTPINVIIDEAVEISKIYSTKDSSKFVNGILDKLQKERH